MAERLTFEGNFCEIARCKEARWGKYCPDGACSQRKVWERLKEYEDALSADVAPVVHCKDCKHLMFSDCYGECGKGHMGIVSPDDFCSYGERRENCNGCEYMGDCDTYCWKPMQRPPQSFCYVEDLQT